jgi:hypothetical protein
MKPFYLRALDAVASDPLVHESDLRWAALASTERQVASYCALSTVTKRGDSALALSVMSELWAHVDGAGRIDVPVERLASRPEVWDHDAWGVLECAAFSLSYVADGMAGTDMRAQWMRALHGGFAMVDAFID